MFKPRRPVHDIKDPRPKTGIREVFRYVFLYSVRWQAQKWPGAISLSWGSS